jgi:WD40 repeat protein
MIERFEFTKRKVITDAHDSDIHCITVLPFNQHNIMFATGAVQQIKFWDSTGICTIVIHDAHIGPIYSITAFLTADQIVRETFRRNEQQSLVDNGMILTGGKDKSLKLWVIKRN